MYLQLCIKKTLFINLSVVCAMQTMSASRVDTYINVWRNTSDQKSETITSNFKILRSVRANSTVWFLQCLYLWTQTQTEQTDWFDRCEAIYLIISLLNIFYRFYRLSVSFIIHAVIFFVLLLCKYFKAFSQYLIGLLQLYISTY